MIKLCSFDISYRTASTVKGNADLLIIPFCHITRYELALGIDSLKAFPKLFRTCEI